MASITTQYRKSHPEYYEKEKKANLERYYNNQEATIKRILDKYNNDEEYKKKVRDNALKRYYRLKEERQKAINAN